MDNINKVFGIGLSRTGTSSLKKALQKLGYSHKIVSNERYINRDISHRCFRNNNAFTDVPIMIMFKELDKKYDNSKFILTTRNLKQWMKSMKWLFDKGSKKFNWEETPYIEKVLLDLYQTTTYEKYKLKESWYRHHHEVYEHFRNRRRDLLVVNWAEGSGWGELCDFLGKEIPNEKFPHKNSSSLKKNMKDKFVSVHKRFNNLF